MHRIFEELKQLTLEKYKQLFLRYNLGFYKLRKNQYKKYLVQISLYQKEKSLKEDEFKICLERKIYISKASDEDEIIAKGNPQVLTFNFDLRAVLNIPKGSEGQIFYLRQLAVLCV